MKLKEFFNNNNNKIKKKGKEMEKVG